MEEERFGFGDNWAKFLEQLDDERIEEAEKSLKKWLNMDDLSGKTFLDVGSGSGLFSLAAKNLGAKVFSFDYDKQSVACTKFLKEKYYKDDDDWNVEWGDALDAEYLSKYGKVDILYSWGVLHHTGDMYKAFANVDELVKDDGTLYIAIYNDQGRRSRKWARIKKRYVNCPKCLRWTILIPNFVKLWFPTFIYDLLRGKPGKTWRDKKQQRGMSPWIDVVDWVGGYPFEVAKPEEVFDFFHQRGYQLTKLYTDGKGLGCNEFVFIKKSI